MEFDNFGWDEDRGWWARCPSCEKAIKHPKATIAFRNFTNHLWKCVGSKKQLKAPSDKPVAFLGEMRSLGSATEADAKAVHNHLSTSGPMSAAELITVGTLGDQKKINDTLFLLSVNRRLIRQDLESGTKFSAK